MQTRIAPALALALLLGAAGPARGDDEGRKPAPAPRSGKDAAAGLRTVVLVLGRADQGAFTPKVQGLAEETLLARRFMLIDEGQLVARYQVEDLEKLLFLAPERSRLAELKARFGADLAVVVQYARRPQFEKEVMGVPTRFFKNDVRVKAVLTDTAEVIYSGGAEGDIEARETGLDELVRAEVKKAADAIAERLGGAVAGGLAAAGSAPRSFEVVVRGYDHEGVRRLLNAIKDRPGVSEVAEREFGASAAAGGGPSATLDVKFRGSADDLKAALATISDPPVEVTATSASRVELSRRAP